MCLAINKTSTCNILKIIQLASDKGVLHPYAVESNLEYFEELVEKHIYDDVILLESQLRVSKNVGARRLGFGLLEHVANKYGWTQAHRQILKTYCEDTDIWVYEYARTIEPQEDIEITLENI